MKLLLLLGALVLSGCASTPTYVLGNQTNSAYHYVFPDKDSPTSRTKCTLYEPPEVERVPAVPLKEYSALKSSELERRLELLLTHIEELRTYIAATRKKHAEAFSRYADNCTAE